MDDLKQRQPAGQQNNIEEFPQEQQFVQQEQKEKWWQKFFLRTWHPEPSILSTIILFLIIGVIFVVLGVVFIVVNNQIKTYKVRYDDKCDVGTQDCQVTINVEDDMDQPIFVFYQLDNFYQNHRRYIKSKSDAQLTGDAISKSTADTACDPIVTNKDMGKTISVTNKPLDEKAVAFPCGLVAKSYFTDTYQLANSEGVKIVINEKDIAWPDDIGNKFKNSKNLDQQWIDLEEDEHFAVWARISALKNFRKLWGRIENDELAKSQLKDKLPKGTYTLAINNTYDSSLFDGKKYFVLSTAGPFGGKNSFIAIAYLVVGSICLAIALFFFIKKRMQPDFGNPEKFK